MLVVQDIHKSFGDFKAVNGASLQVQKGQIVAVIGPNGAGKTTLFNLICGQLRPDRGRVIFDGQDITRLPPHKICKCGVARSFQIANIFPRLTVFRNVQVSVLSEHKKSRVLFRSADNLLVEETMRILDQVRLSDKAEVIAGSLSHGDLRILEIAMALGGRPRLLVLDEPTAGMSPDETKRTMDLVKVLSDREGLTILFCEHDMDIVFNVAHSIMVMHHGKTLIQSTPEEVRKNRDVQEAYLGTEDA
ncbi:MAG TPA: ABC transporter ATP-binding protein [Desulfobacterales bacterium]|nr:ABC transporter ATP-binding protein [Desulfobacterales bacterium]